VTLAGRRDGRPLVVRVAPGEWQLELRPRLGPEQAALHAGARRNEAGRPGEAAAAWQRLCRELAPARPRAAAWLAARGARAAYESALRVELVRDPEGLGLALTLYLSSAELMARFYARLRAGEPAAEALRAAQRELRARPETSHPYHWAGFALSGDAR
jgi:hypothetical protein